MWSWESHVGVNLSVFRSHFFCPQELEEAAEWNLIKSLFEVRKCTGPTGSKNPARVMKEEERLPETLN